jgi:glycosyltransferase involved in cell wall biosynthesis
MGRENSGVDLAVFHGLPPAGGAFRVLTEYIRHAPEHRFTVYTRRAEEPAQIELAAGVQHRRLPPLPVVASDAERRALLRAFPSQGAEAAAAIDAGGHEAVLCLDTETIQAPEVLPHLRTPSLYYAPEPEREFVEPRPRFGRDRSPKAWLARRIGPTTRLQRRLYRTNLRAAPDVVTHSQHTAGQLRDAYGVQAEVVYLGVDADAFSPGDGARDRFVLSVGTLHPLKGHQFVIEAVAHLPSPRPPIVVVGAWGSLEPQLRAAARARGVELDLRIGVPFVELLDLYRRAGVLACGQIREPFGLLVLEAMATGLPVVAVAEGGFVESVRDGETGMLVPRDARTFGRAIEHVLDNRALADRLAAAGRADVIQRWTWSRHGAGWTALLQRAAQSSSAAAAAG